MKRSLIFFRSLMYSVLMLLASCATVDQTGVNPPAPPLLQTQSPTTQENLGEQVARHLTERYNNTASNCGSSSTPSFICNGVMIRGTANNPTFHVWNNSPAARAKGGVSFSYLRSDAKFKTFAYGYTNGYIMTAYSFVPEKFKPQVLCFFPIDAGSVYRDNKGCGAFSYQGSQFPGSGPCHLNGVVTLDQWWQHYNAHSESRHSWQCGFDVSDGRDQAGAVAFATGVAAMKRMGNESFETQNELILAYWNDGLGKTLPLEAFFYLRNSAQGKADAQRNQRDLRDTDGVVIPVISVQLPQSPGAQATFYYLAGDQAVTLPPAKP